MVGDKDVYHTPCSYVSIKNINTPVFFPQLGKFMPAYTFISLVNLDLCIQTCVYNRDDYTKMWLQLAFPFYLIFTATSLIIPSRYSTTIQRLTAHRALPVLATLFLLSYINYTKILLIVSSVLFSYSKIIHLPGDHTPGLVWSVDGNVPLFGVKFITTKQDVKKGVALPKSQGEKCEIQSGSQK